MAEPLLRVENLRIQFQTEDGCTTAVEDVSFTVNRGENLALLGPSGSGKTLSALACMGLLPGNARVAGGSIFFEGRDITRLTEREMGRLRGGGMAMVFQEPLSSLDPVLSIGYQIGEALRLHTHLDRRQTAARTGELLRMTGIPDTARAYPHQLSGGMRQRALIAMAIACKPRLLIADEPATALDAGTQARILRLLKEIQAETGLTMLLITHDFAVAKEMSEEAVLINEGRTVSQGKVESGGALCGAGCGASCGAGCGASCGAERPLSPPIEQGEALLTVGDLRVWYQKKGFLPKQGIIKAVDGVSFSIYHRETLGLVGESGCGKSSLARAIVRLEETAGGKIIFQGEDITGCSAAKMRRLRRAMQIIFQDPSLNPRQTLEGLLAEVLSVHKVVGKNKIGEEIDRLIRLVGLKPEQRRRLPHEFSGGEKQRICIARALAVRPGLLICDEIISSLDVPVQRQILALLRDLSERLGLSCLFISHNLEAVRLIARRTAVMHQGRIVRYTD